MGKLGMSPDIITLCHKEQRVLPKIHLTLHL